MHKRYAGCIYQSKKNIRKEPGDSFQEISIFPHCNLHLLHADDSMGMYGDIQDQHLFSQLDPLFKQVGM